MDRITYSETADGRTVLRCVVTRPLDSGYARLVVFSAIEFLRSGEHASVAGITVSAPIANAHSARVLELAARDARDQGIHGRVVVDAERCELRLTRTEGCAKDQRRWAVDPQDKGRTDVAG
jgi:hypothetical protein